MALGPLESRMMALLWQLRSATVRDVLDSGEISGAYTTVMTTLDRLHKKGLLNREPEGRAFRYSPAQSQDEFNGDMVRDAIAHMMSATKSSRAPISFLVDAISQHDKGLLDELEREIERKRCELESEK